MTRTKTLTLGSFDPRTVAYSFPKTYTFFDLVNLEESWDHIGKTATIVGRICKHNIRNVSAHLVLQTWLIEDDDFNTLTCVRFHNNNKNPHIGSSIWTHQQIAQYPVGTEVAVQGKLKDDTFVAQSGTTIPRIKLEVEVISTEPDRIEVIRANRPNEININLLNQSLEKIADPLADIVGNKMMGLHDALRTLHFPPNRQKLEQARSRLVFDELLYLSLYLLRRKKAMQSKPGEALKVQGELMEQFLDILPFELTNAQQRVVNEIQADLEQPMPMNRMVQGDVGSGKTVVAVAAILAAIQSGQQSALMAPTEVLATQHFHKISAWFEKLGLVAKLLTNSSRIKERREISAGLFTGGVHLLIGTHAMLEPIVQFQKLGLVVVDEQHRFGVEQRAALLAKGANPHLLSMTATPIPRTLALAIHGDLDFSVINELPPGRTPIVTKVLKDCPDTWKRMERAIEIQTRKGQQVYVILPLVKESEKLDLRNAEQEHDRLRQLFPELNIGLLHGKLKSAEKNQALQDFAEGLTQVLVSTTVVEVGVDVPNATLMIIEHAERFGLAQLHQLRGRVGRGSEKSYCLLIDSSKTDKSQLRLEVMEQSTDGAFLAQMDLQMRGAGDLLGTKQSGLPEFALADLSNEEDQRLVLKARKVAERLIDQSLPVSILVELELRHAPEQQMILN